MSGTIYHRVKMVAMRLLILALCLSVLGLTVLIVQAHSRSNERADILRRLADLQAQVQKKEEEKNYLLLITATQEAEGNALAKLAREHPEDREKVDAVRAQTRRYQVTLRDTGAGAKTPEEAFAELCRSYGSNGDGCY